MTRSGSSARSSRANRGSGKRRSPKPCGTNRSWWYVPRTLSVVESAEFLTDQQTRDIFYNNAARFLRLEEIVR